MYPTWLSPEVFSGFPLRWYSLSYITAFFITYLLASYLSKRTYKELSEHLSNLVIWAILGMIIGARLFSKLIYSKDFSVLLQPWEMFWPFLDGKFVGIQGLSYHGGVIGAGIAMLLYARIYRLQPLRVLDIIAVTAPLGYTLGRLGNFANGELYGRVSTVPWGIIFPNAEQLPYGNSRVQQIADSLEIAPGINGLVNLPRHPSQLYEAFFEGIFCFVILFTLFKLIRKTRYYLPGSFSLLYIILYSTARFIIEYFRQPDEGLNFIVRFSENNDSPWFLSSLLDFSMGQILSVIFIIFSLLILLFLWMRARNPLIQHATRPVHVSTRKKKRRHQHR